MEKGMIMEIDGTVTISTKDFQRLTEDSKMMENVLTCIDSYLSGKNGCLEVRWKDGKENGTNVRYLTESKKIDELKEENKALQRTISSMRHAKSYAYDKIEVALNDNWRLQSRLDKALEEIESLKDKLEKEKDWNNWRRL